MRSCMRLAGSWTVAGPTCEDGAWEFGGTATPGTLRIQGIDSIVFNAHASSGETAVATEQTMVLA